MDLREQRRERSNLDCLIERLELEPTRDAAEIGTIRSLWRTGAQHRFNTEIATWPTPRLITSGWAAWCRRTDAGRKVIFLFLMPGDVITPAIASGVDGYGVVALTPLRTVDAGELLRGDTGGTCLAPHARAMIESADGDYRTYLLDHLTWLGDGGGTRNLARLLLELHARLNATGRCIDDRMEIPVGQRILAQALALSAVQVNKILGQLRARSILSSVRGSIRIDDIAALRRCASAAAKPGAVAGGHGNPAWQQPALNSWQSDWLSVGAAII